jgi:hypothetical protein
MSQTTSTPRALSALARTSLTLVFSAGAMIAATAAEEGPPADLKPAPMQATAPRFVSFWGPFTSEENPPLTASNYRLISAMQCTGDYCDNVALGYEIVPRINFTENTWSPYFSEEGNNRQTCAGFMTGISCQGSYCDNVSIQCTLVSGLTKGSCAWQPWFSEEARYSYLPPGYYAAGLACRGSYCDDFSIFACQGL